MSLQRLQEKKKKRTRNEKKKEMYVLQSDYFKNLIDPTVTVL